MFTVINGTEFPLAVNLRVAYMVQGYNNHKPYAEVFQGIGDMVVEDQIDILYASFSCANKDEAKTFTKQMFRDYYLDNYTLRDLMDQLQAVIKGIMGEDDTTEPVPADAAVTVIKSDDASAGDSGN